MLIIYTVTEYHVWIVNIITCITNECSHVHVDHYEYLWLYFYLGPLLYDLFLAGNFHFCLHSLGLHLTLVLVVEVQSDQFVVIYIQDENVDYQYTTIVCNLLSLFLVSINTKYNQTKYWNER